MENLRERLRYMGAHVVIDAHPAFVRALLSDGYDHSIRLVPDALGQVRPADLTCFGYALDLHNSSRWVDVKGELHVINAGFVQTLIEEGVLQKTRRPHEDDVVVYRRVRVEHAGVFKSGRVRSKWGTGWVYEHGIWEVPAQYGQLCEFYERPQIEAIEEAYDRLRHKPEIAHFSLLNMPDDEDEI